WGEGIRGGIPSAEAAAEAVADAVADYLIGESPPPKGPLSEIDKGGAHTIAAWFGGIRSEIDAQGGGLTTTLRVLMNTMFDALIRVTEERYPEFAEFLRSLNEDMAGAMSSVDDLTRHTGSGTVPQMRRASEAAIQWTQNLNRGLADAIAYGRSLGDVLENVARGLASQFLEQRVLGPLLGLGRQDGGWLASIISGLPIFHMGGLVMGGPGIAVMHNGGMIQGLRTDEVPIIAQVGERVLSRAQNDRFEQMLEEGRDVHHHYYIEAVDAKSFADLVARNPEAIKMVALHDLASNGELRRAI